MLASLGAIVVNVLLEGIGPSRCSSCEASVAPRTLFCPACAVSVEPADPLHPAGAGALAAFEYGGSVATAIARLKYQDRADLAPRLGAAMVPVAKRIRGAVDLVVPVPLHPRRLAERGYNQAALLAVPVARALELRHAPRALVRVRDTPQQARLDRADRLVNLSGAFRPRDAIVQHARILLVDDVRTTGATLEGCARALHEAGARQVVALVLARRIPS